MLGWCQWYVWGRSFRLLADQYNSIIIFQSMTTNQVRQGGQPHGKFLNHHILFKKNTNPQRLTLFDNNHSKIDTCLPNRNSKGKQIHLTPVESSDQSNFNVTKQKIDAGRNMNKINADGVAINGVGGTKVTHSPLKRAFSSNRFDLLSTKQCRKKGKKMMGKIFEYTKAVKNSSKKSTDESSSEPIQTLKAENEQMREIIRWQETKMRKLEHAILEEKKRHELQKHLYNQNIQKLKKLAGVQDNDPQHPTLSVVIDQDYDQLSVQSN